MISKNSERTVFHLFLFVGNVSSAFKAPKKLRPEDLLSQVVVLAYGMEVMVGLG